MGIQYNTFVIHTLCLIIALNNQMLFNNLKQETLTVIGK